MCDATPLANAAPAADDRGAPNTVASFDAPSCKTTACANRAGRSLDPASAEPSQSRTARRVSPTTAVGRSAYRVAERTSARRRVTGVSCVTRLNMQTHPSNTEGVTGRLSESRVALPNAHIGHDSIFGDRAHRHVVRGGVK